jgi:hypothetical protein
MLLPYKEFHHPLDNQAEWPGVLPVTLKAHCLLYGSPVYRNWGKLLMHFSTLFVQLPVDCHFIMHTVHFPLDSKSCWNS